MNKIGLACGLAAAAVVAMGAKGCGTSTPVSSQSAVTQATLPPVVTTTATTVPLPTLATMPPTTVGPKTLLDTTGTGDKTTEPFTAAGAWHIAYSYNCANFGQPGNFAVEVQGGDGFTDQGPDTQGMSGQDSNYEPKGGTFSLQVLSECQWHLTVTG